MEKYISYAKHELKKSDLDILLDRIIDKSSQYSTFFLLNTASDALSFPEPRKMQFIAGLGVRKIHEDANQKLKTGKFRFTTISYDLKNRFENLSSKNPTFIQHPEFLLVEPEIVITCTIDHLLEIYVDTAEVSASDVLDQLLSPSNFNISAAKGSATIGDFKWTSSDDEYLKTVESIRQEIEEGNVYELNYCRNCIAQDVTINPTRVYKALFRSQGTPFMAFVKWNNLYCLSASMERFLCKNGSKIVSQPIKGTAARDKNKGKESEEIENLRQCEKEQAENLMIVDLVRNDLNRIAKNHSVSVDELFGIYSYPSVHQMISTISCDSDSDNLLEILKATFPMGSMTGAPKISAMQLIEKYENFKRGLYSGSIGYISPDGNFDFNVVIRTLLYDQKEKVAQIPVGSAITYDSDAKKELEECKVKIQKILETIVES